MATMIKTNQVDRTEVLRCTAKTSKFERLFCCVENNCNKITVIHPDKKYASFDSFVNTVKAFVKRNNLPLKVVGERKYGYCYAVRTDVA